MTSQTMLRRNENPEAVHGVSWSSLFHSYQITFVSIRHAELLTKSDYIDTDSGQWWKRETFPFLDGPLKVELLFVETLKKN